MRLLIYYGNQDPASIRPVIERMLASDQPSARESGGELAAFAAMEWATDDLLDRVLLDRTTEARRGAAHTCAHRLPHTDNVTVGATALVRLAHDPDDKVQEEVSTVAGALRGERLRPFAEFLTTLMDSPSFTHAVPQLLITLERAPDRVDDLILHCARRFTDVFETDAGDIRTGAAGDARQIGELMIRGLAQSQSTTMRSAFLDAIDNLLMVGAYGIEELISASER